MSDWITWLDQHQGSTMVFLTAVYVVATVWVCLLMRRSNRLSAEALDRSIEYQKESTRPYVVFDLEEWEDNLLVAVLSNVGERPALNIEVHIDPPLNKLETEVKKIIEESPHVPCTLTTNKIAFLAPGRRLYDHIEYLSTFLKDHKDTVYEVEVSYCDSQGEKYAEEVKINFGFYWNRLTIGEKREGRGPQRSGYVR